MAPSSEHQRAELAAIAEKAMRDRGFLPEFSPEAKAEAERMSEDLGGVPESRGVRDLRRLLWCSIDNDDTRDLDQLTVADPLSDGRIRVCVAVADVESRVPEGSAIDRHAGHNTTSVYTPPKVFPMLPERLSTGITSLNEGEDRLAVVVDFVVLPDGAVLESELYQAVVHNHAKLAYNSLAAWLEGDSPQPDRLAGTRGLDGQIRLQDQAAQRLRKLRYQRGALDIRRNEVRPILDGDRVDRLEEDGSNRAKELIQDFMIAANEATARFLEGHGFPSIRRVVRTPARWPRIVELAATHGTRLPAEPDSKALSDFLEERRKADPEDYPDLSLSIVKLIGSGEYVVDLPGEPAPGHFGLAVGDYTHATAPNRRYPDLVTHRLLKAALDNGSPPYSLEALAEIARHCTDQENEANKVERQVKKAAAALLLENRVGQHFDAVVTGASHKGTWVRLCRLGVEGRLEKGWQGLDVGDRVRVRLIGTDAERGFIDFARSSHDHG
ncbi:MAG TPA: RNB domain-containing ribonuclease [Thermoanaerobaculia bacterium]|nr:RNB domain-containing ribonuclease [Thermoanaerobaculia bacterium]